MEFFKELLNHILGGASPAYFVATVFFVLFGACITILFDVHTRNEHSGRTPEKWSWLFFWNDNKLRFILNLLMAFSIIRFFPDITGVQLSLFWAFSVGIVFDGLLVVYKKLKKMANNKINDVFKVEK